jgi:hypothetical protein
MQRPRNWSLDEICYLIFPLECVGETCNSDERKQLRITTREKMPDASGIVNLGLLDKGGLLRKLNAPREGPHRVLAVYTNGVVKI